MTFIWPAALLLLVVVAGLAVLYVLAQRRRNRYALRYANLSLVREAIGKGPGWRRHVPPVLFIFALGFMAIAVARPQAVVAVPSQEGTVILAIDVSGSMLAEDMKPNRMEAAKAAARAFVEKQSESVKIGVVSFSGDASIVQSPTTDKTLVIAAINRLRPQRAHRPRRGHAQEDRRGHRRPVLQREHRSRPPRRLREPDDAARRAQ